MKKMIYFVIVVLLILIAQQTSPKMINEVKNEDLKDNTVILKMGESNWYNYVECNGQTFKSYGETKNGACVSDMDCKDNFQDGISNELGARLVCCSGMCGVYQ